GANQEPEPGRIGRSYESGGKQVRQPQGSQTGDAASGAQGGNQGRPEHLGTGRQGDDQREDAARLEVGHGGLRRQGGVRVGLLRAGADGHAAAAGSADASRPRRQRRRRQGGSGQGG